MKKRSSVVLILLSSLLWVPAITSAQTGADDAEIEAARKARDAASVEALQKIVAKTKTSAAKANTSEAYVRLALFYTWLCEAIESSQKNELFKPAAEDGVAAAEKAVELNPRSADAHQLLGDLLNQLIPHILGGGMRYGARATDEIEKALELDPQNVNAYVSRSIIYYYTPENFGGSKTKAFEMLKKAVEIDPKADAPHIWLAFFYLDAKKTQEALKEITAAREINPNRAFTNYVYAEVVKSSPKPKSAKPAAKNTSQIGN